MAKTKTIKSRMLMSLRAKIDDARNEGWIQSSDVWRVNGEYCVVVKKDGA